RCMLAARGSRPLRAVVNRIELPVVRTVVTPMWMARNMPPREVGVFPRHLPRGGPMQTRHLAVLLLPVIGYGTAACGRDVPTDARPGRMATDAFSTDLSQSYQV